MKNWIGINFRNLEKKLTAVCKKEEQISTYSDSRKLLIEDQHGNEHEIYLLGSYKWDKSIIRKQWENKGWTFESGNEWIFV